MKRNSHLSITNLFLIAVAVFLFLSASTTLYAQDALETGWKFSVTGAYSNLGNTPTNNGFLTVIERRVASHWSVRFDNIQTASPVSTLLLVGPVYQLSLGHIIKPNQYLDSSKYEVFVHSGAGTGRAGSNAGPSGPYRYAISIGGGLTYRANDTFFLRPIDIQFVRSSVPGAPPVFVIGNHVDLAAGFGLRF